MPKNTDRLFVHMLNSGYSEYQPEWGKMISGTNYVAMLPLAFHWMIIRGHVLDAFGPSDRWCFATATLAAKAIEAWPIPTPEGYEPDGWHRHPATGRRRPDGDKTKEFIEY